MSDQEPQTQEPPESADPAAEGPPALERAAAVAQHRFRVWLRNVQFTAYTTLVMVLLALGFLWPRIFIVVPPGCHAVMYRFLAGGTVTNRVWGEGLNIIPPWDALTVYETRLQQRKLKFDVLSEEGLNLGVEVSIRYRPNKEMLGFLHQDIGTEYFERLIQPEVESHVRRTFGNRPAYEIYASSRDVLQELGQIPVLGRLEETGDEFSSRPYVIIQELKLVDIELPAIVESAIADKYKQEQLMLEYRYKLEREEKEAERKRTEAAGIRDYNIIASKVNPDLLRWRSIEATLDLAKAPNSKVVVLGGGHGAQLLMNVEPAIEGGAPAASAASAAPAPPQPAGPPNP
ncbi:prohibitin family protein [Polyangium sp. y55x31]|uniref:prohibitin family protein n=1 Tax=Polyangium sp. y55x31 TaxID=3042688 RepID=UPI00248319E1|nr:prohibitin family protein [Polyangium sp. y55x31]MDI1475038.1 prohibitin family protein [Polyangium sp. y55x31]